MRFIVASKERKESKYIVLIVFTLLQKKKARTNDTSTTSELFSHHIFNISSFVRLPQLISDMEDFNKMLEVVI